MKNYSEITWTELNRSKRISPVCGINAVSTPQIMEYLGVTSKELAATRTKLSRQLKRLGMFTESMKNLFDQIPGAEKLSGFEYVLPLEDGSTVHVSGGPIVYCPAGAVALLADEVRGRRTGEEAAYTYRSARSSHPPVRAMACAPVVFTNPEFGKVRVVEVDGEPWLVGRDIAVALGYSNTRKALADHVDAEDKGVTKCDTLGGAQEMTIINESGLYSLVLSSKLPGAKKFRRWVTSEVLPSIRKHGGYIAGQEQMSDEEILARALIFAQNKIDERDRQIAGLKMKVESDAPKVAFADAVHDSKHAISVEKFSKLLYDKCGVNIGRNNMFRLLRNMGYLRENNMPYQKYLNAGYFTTYEVIRNRHPFVVTGITGKGQTWLFGKIANIYQ